MLSIFVALSVSQRAHAELVSTLDSHHRFVIEGSSKKQGELINTNVPASDQ